MTSATAYPSWLSELIPELPGVDWNDTLLALADSAPPPRPVVLPPGPLMAWRAWRVTDDGHLAGFYGGAAVWPSSGWVSAECVYGPLFGQQHKGSAPQSTCFCGIHVIRDQGEMFAYMRARQHREDSWALGPVQFRGPAFRGAFPNADWGPPGDPPTTLRVGRARLVGPLLLSKTAASLRPALEAHYGRVSVSDGPTDHVDEYGHIRRDLHELVQLPASPPSNVWKAVESRGTRTPLTTVQKLYMARERIATYVRACEAVHNVRKSGLASPLASPSTA